MLNIILVAVGGAAGSVLRYGVGVLAGRWLGFGFPFGTLFVNVTGSFLMGVLVEVLARRAGVSNELRLLLATGLLGGYTTFSSFSLDVAFLWERGQAAAALLYISCTLIAGLLSMAAGIWLVRSLA
ncbi:fluoride efflux transporter CrcB [Aureimonas fodinaquatilis]|uniref:Fluoride-specific ion channel FluC n=1 Tax=Aureimonas fodinaquatilis TaxID=2565783 RepID=A0A5B0DVK0_9HYPH|nr:fluoride efflux transporter CrcB [Aureimonas fodinaquatilis]KAA0970857.1 fluoride efflux transporter CrcB [Aureimonas fodinaquatilis]